MRRSGFLVVVRGLLLAGAALAAFLPAASAQTVILDMDTVRHKPTEVADKDNQKVPAGTVELVEGKFGKACLFSLREAAGPGFMTAWVAATPEWDEAAGLSFWVKGDGSTHWGGLELIDGNDYALRYGYCFPIDSTEWTRVVVPWRDLIPELAGPLVGAKGGFAPSAFRNVWFGKWFYWRERPAHSYAIDQMVLEKTIDPDRADATAERAGASRVLAKLKAKKAVTIVTMGDSLSDKRHWANRQVLWSELLVGKIKEKYGAEATLVNPAIGGTTLTQNLILMPQWLKGTPKPDLVTVWFGYNDWSSGMRGPAFQETLRAAVDRLRRLTRGRSEVLLITSCPSMERWHAMEEFAGAARAVAAERKTGLADVAAAFHERGLLVDARPTLYCDDKTHLGGPGHLLACQTVLKAIADGPDGK